MRQEIPKSKGMRLGTAQRPAVGEKVCGDAFAVLSSGAVTIVAVADGLGHGPHAAEASQAFCAYVKEHHEEGLVEILQGAHECLHRTRGAAAALLRIDEKCDRMKFAGVGNISLSAISQAEVKPVSNPGILGSRMRKLQEFEYQLARGDLLILFSDGVSSRFVASRYQKLDPEEMASAIMKEHGVQHDDVTCVVIRY